MAAARKSAPLPPNFSALASRAGTIIAPMQVPAPP